MERMNGDRNKNHRKLYAYFLWNAKWHSFVFNNRQISCVCLDFFLLFIIKRTLAVSVALMPDHDQKNLNISSKHRGTVQFCTDCASGIQTNLKRHSKSNHTNNQPHTKATINSSQSNHKTIAIRKRRRRKRKKSMRASLANWNFLICLRCCFFLICLVNQ